MADRDEPHDQDLSELLASLTEKEVDILCDVSPFFAIFEETELARLVALGLIDYGVPFERNPRYFRAERTTEGERFLKAARQLRAARKALGW